MMIAAALVFLLLLCAVLSLDLTWSNETRSARNELVFAERNRAYGAYRLRTEYGSRMGIALLGAMGLFGAAVVIPVGIAHYRTPVIADGPIPHVAVDVDLSRVFTLPPEQPKPIEPKAAVVTPPAKQDPGEQHLVEAVDTMVQPRLPDADTSSLATAPGACPGSDGGDGAAIGNTTGADTGMGAGTGASVWNGYEVQVLPEFPGGEPALGEWVRKNLEFPPDMAGRDMVYVQFIIGLDGSVQEVKAVKGKQAAYRNAAERTIRNMPRWKPARMNGHDVRCRLTLPIKFETR